MSIPLSEIPTIDQVRQLQEKFIADDIKRKHNEFFVCFRNLFEGKDFNDSVTSYVPYDNRDTEVIKFLAELTTKGYQVTQVKQSWGFAGRPTYKVTVGLPQ